jgi:hypothetical protein
MKAKKMAQFLLIIQVGLLLGLSSYPYKNAAMTFVVARLKANPGVLQI